MRQTDAIERVYSAVMKDNIVRAIFLKGSIARGECDEYSDVDFYCIVDTEKKDEFLKRRISYLENYKPLIYYSYENFVGPQVVGVFEDELHFDLYTVTFDSLPKTDKIKVMYDPEGLLKDYEQKKFILSNDEVAECYGNLSFALLEFEAAYKRNDLIWASRLGSHVSGELSLILRYVYDKENARLGLKRLNTKLDNGMYEKLKTAVDLIAPSHLPDGVIMLCEIADEMLDKIPMEVSDGINKKFFYFMYDRMKKLK